jgi:hypothetical protein
MRVVGTIVVGFLFAVAFAAFFLFQSVSGYPTSTEDVVETLRAGDVRTAALDTLEDVVRREVRNQPADPVFAEFVLSQARTVIEQAITEEWFYDTIAQAHRGLIDFLERGADSVRIDLSGIKERLRDTLWELGRHGVEMCDAVGGGRECCDAARDLQRTLRRYRGQVDDALARVPDQVNLTWLLTLGGVRPGEVERATEVQRIRELLATLGTVRWIGLGALLLLFGLVVLINIGSLPRVLAAAGAVLCVASASYLVAVPRVTGAAADWAVERLDETRTEAIARGAPEYPQLAARRVVEQALRRVGGYAVAPVSTTLVAGALLLAGGIVWAVLRRRRLHPDPRAMPPPPPPPYAGPMPPGYYPPPAQ